MPIGFEEIVKPQKLPVELKMKLIDFVGSVKLQKRLDELPMKQSVVGMKKLKDVEKKMKIAVDEKKKNVADGKKKNDVVNSQRFALLFILFFGFWKAISYFDFIFLINAFDTFLFDVKFLKTIKL